jgi:heme exporter protein A
LSPAPRAMRLGPVGTNVILEEAGVSLGGHAVLRDISLSLGPTDVLGIAGPNGSGKTTLLRLLATLARLDVGSGRVLGAALGTPDVYAIRPQIGLIGHVPALIPELSLRENLDHATRLAGKEINGVDRALRVVGLEGAADRKVTQSSHGMLRRAEVARLLLTRPRLLLLDEAFSGLDASARDLIDALVERAVSAEGSVVMVSHDATHLAERCQRISTITSGRLEAMA